MWLIEGLLDKVLNVRDRSVAHRLAEMLVEHLLVTVTIVHSLW